MAKKRYRINGKFVKFKDFIKINGLDAVNYETLNTQEKRIWSGLNTYENRIKLENGQFLNKTTLNKLKRDTDLKTFAAKNNMSIDEYLKQNIDTILKFNAQAFEITKNGKNVDKFILNSNGKFHYKGEEISKNELIKKLQGKRNHQLKKNNKFINIYRFKIENNGNKITLEEIEDKGSNDDEE